MNGRNVDIGFVYKPLRVKISDLLEHFEDSLVRVLPLCDDILTLGGFNINLLNPNRSDVKYLSVDENYDFFFQMIAEPTTRFSRETISSIDHLLVPDGTLVNDCSVDSLHNFSDYRFISCTLK